MNTKFFQLRAARACVVLIVGFSPLVILASADAAKYEEHGRTTADLNIRKAPSINSARSGGIAKNTRVAFDCKVRGTTIGGQKWWYGLKGKRGWVSARYVKIIDREPELCTPNDGHYAGVRVTQDTVKKAAPFRADATLGSMKKSSKLYGVECYLQGQRIADTSRWYYLSGDYWVSGARVKHEPRGVPEDLRPCNRE